MAPVGVTSAKVRWVLEVSDDLRGVPFELWITEDCCEAGYDGAARYGTRGRWWDGCVFDPALVEIYEINSFACTCCVPWYVDGMFIGDFLPGFRYFIGTTEWTAECSKPPCFPGTEVHVEVAIGDVESTADLAFTCAPTIEVPLDVEPQVCPNLVGDGPFASSTVPVGILGTDGFDVRTIDPSTVVLYTPEHHESFSLTLPPTFSNVTDLATPVDDGVPCECITDGPDGWEDLILHFGRRRVDLILGALEWEGMHELGVAGLLHDGTPFIAIDCVGSDGVPRASTSTPFEPAVPTLGPADPNPARGPTVVSYQIPTDTFVDVTVFDTGGRKVASLVHGEKTAGRHAVTWDARAVAPGVYFYRLEAGAVTLSRQFVVLR